MLQEGPPHPEPKGGLFPTLKSELSKESPVLTKQEILSGKGTWAESSRVMETRRTALPRGSQSRVFLVMALGSVLSLASHSDSESFLVVYTLLSQDGC